MKKSTAPPLHPDNSEPFADADRAQHRLVSELYTQLATANDAKDFTDTHTMPLVIPGRAIFLWVGEAREVHLLRWIHGGVERTAFRRFPGAPAWLLHLPVQDGGRFEYKLGINRGQGEEWILDPLNPARAGDPYGENSVCKTFGYQRPQWSMPQGAPAGVIESLKIVSSVFEESREEKVYLPAAYSPLDIYPLLIIHDGEDFMAYGDLTTSLDNLIASGTIPPVVAALVQTRDRLGEYARGRRHARYLVNDVLPRLEQRYTLSSEPKDRVLLGASLGAVASLATVFRYPGVFGGVVLQSGSFVLDERKLEGRPHPVFRRIARLVRAFKRTPQMPEIRAFVSTGELEGLASENRALAALLHENGITVQFKSSWDGHHWHNWRDQLRDALVWVLRG